MTYVMVRYKVKPDRVEENEALVRAVYEELRELGPPGFWYRTFRLDDEGRFLHLASLEDGAKNPLPDLDAFKAFQACMPERAEEPPVATQPDEVGSYTSI